MKKYITSSRWIGLCCLLLATTACLGPLDTLGVVAVVSDTEDLYKDPAVEDDRIEDKNPACRADLTTEEIFDGCTFTVNKSCSVTKLDVQPFQEDLAHLETALFPNRQAAIDALSEHGVDLLPSMEVINGVLKPFNDGLYAAIEMGVQQGIPEVLLSKRQFLRDLAGACISALQDALPAERSHLESGLVFVVAALMASGQDTSDLALSSDLRSQAAGIAEDFLDNAQVSRPIGFYTWNDTLEEVFAQDRFLQNRQFAEEWETPDLTEFGRFAALAGVMQDATGLTQPYHTYLALYQGLTNPYAAYSVEDLYPHVSGVSALGDLGGAHSDFLAESDPPFVCRGTWLALFPGSRSPDTDFFSQLYCQSPPPPEANLINALINTIRDGLLDLEPTETSGWYDYQLWALQTLLVPESLPESDHLLLTAAYKKKLIETFKSLLTQTRETHVKQLTVFSGPGSAPTPSEVDVYPKYPVEPFPTFYLRTARAYRFLETYLKGVLGTGFLAATHRLQEDNSLSEETLGTELNQITELVYGIYALSARSVGLDPADYLLEEETLEYPMEGCEARASQWVEGWQSDPEVLRDPRVIVPVGNSGEGETFYWAILGVKAIRISAEFVEGHVPQFTPQGMCELRDILDHHYVLLMEEMQEVRIPTDTPPPTREEFRAICDQYDTAAEIIAALEAL